MSYRYDPLITSLAPDGDKCPQAHRLCKGCRHYPADCGSEGNRCAEDDSKCDCCRDCKWGDPHLEEVQAKCEVEDPGFGRPY